jgi:hypothetical protein
MIEQNSPAPPPPPLVVLDPLPPVPAPIIVTSTDETPAGTLNVNAPVAVNSCDWVVPVDIGQAIH